MNEIKNEIYKQELIDLQAKMIKAEKWADKMPVFRDVIISNKISGEEQWLKYTERYKKIPLSWGVNRGYFGLKSSRTITNYKGEYTGYLWTIYINSCNLYDSHNEHDLDNVVANNDIFFFDRLNTTFYVTDDQIESLLEALNDWYIMAVEKEKEIWEKERIEKIELELSKLKNKQK